MNVAIIQPVVPHYRAALFRELLTGTEHTYFIVADKPNHETIRRSREIECNERFQTARTWKIGPLEYQTNVVSLARAPNLDCIIFCGNAHYISVWVAALLGRISGKRILFWTHGWLRVEKGPKRWIRNTFYRLAHALLLYGEEGKRIGQLNSFSAEKMHVVFNSLDHERQRAVRAEITPEDVRNTRRTLFAAPDRPMVICVSRVTASCRFDMLLDAQELLLRQGHWVNVLLVGDGPARCDLQASATKRKLPVHFFGAEYDESVLGKLTMAANVTVSPGKVGLTAMQSLGYGIPVITHDDPAQQGPEWEAIIPGITGDFFRRNDIQDLAAVILRWTKQPTVEKCVSNECFRIIESRYTPRLQAEAFNKAVKNVFCAAHSSNRKVRTNRTSTI